MPEQETSIPTLKKPAGEKLNLAKKVTKLEKQVKCFRPLVEECVKYLHSHSAAGRAEPRPLIPGGPCAVAMEKLKKFDQEK